MPPTRRTYLTTIGSAATIGLAGCTGDSGLRTTSHNCELADREPVAELPHPTQGDDDATVTVDLFEDFACPHCATFALEDFGRLVDEYAGEDVRFRRFDFLVVRSDWNEPVANAARSVQDALDDGAFFEFAEAAYENQSEYSWQVIGDIAEAVDADPCRVLSDADGGTYDSVIQADQTEAENRGVTGTPIASVDGQLLERVASYENVSSAIDDAL